MPLNLSGPTACIASTWCSCCWHPCGNKCRGTCLIFWGHQSQSLRPGTLSSLHWHGTLYFLCQPSTYWVWRCIHSECPQWAPGHQHKEASRLFKYPLWEDYQNFHNVISTRSLLFYMIWMVNDIQFLIWIGSQILQFFLWNDLTIGQWIQIYYFVHRL